MKRSSLFGFLTPRWINVGFTALILCMPILREQYSGGQYVAWYRPIVVFYDYLREPRSIQPFFLMLALTFLIYLVVCLIVALAFKLLRKK